MAIANFRPGVRGVSPLLPLLLLLWVGSFPSPVKASDLVLVGGTLIDVDHGGSSTDDVADAVVVIHDGTITRVGSRGKVAITPGSRVLDVRGSYLVPGLIDGFGALRGQAFADAYLYEGVTSVLVTESPIGTDGEQVIADLAHGPRLLRGATISGYSLTGTVPKQSPWSDHRAHDRPLSKEELTAEIDHYAAQGFRSLMISLDVLPEQLPMILDSARRHHMATFGEVAFTPYSDAIRDGIGVLIRNDHYETALSPAADRAAYADDPMGNGALRAVRGVCDLALTSETLAQLGDQLAHSTTALMPVLTIESTADDLGTPSPWAMRSAAFVNPSDLDDPVDPTTGGRPYLLSHPDRKDALRACAQHREDIDSALHQRGALYLAGSGAPSFGILPGGGLHQELRSLQKIGLTPRQALAAATSSYAELFRWNDVGQIAAGRAADILVVTSDPRKDIAALEEIQLVVHDGQLVDRQALLARATGRKPDAR